MVLWLMERGEFVVIDLMIIPDLVTNVTLSRTKVLLFMHSILCSPWFITMAERRNRGDTRKKRRDHDPV
jgi:hypothetical protein